ncbi:serpin-ZX-like isoform X2 [Punica granatum]|uniref:Serpin-ZX-like isoform X2 n=1 Tax=Punica granatum TaxID=22663 RepID=A0A6P8D1E0_PUNGR|nr:serpin-ZX-like isoform X2 [Punica granatum]
MAIRITLFQSIARFNNRRLFHRSPTHAQAGVALSLSKQLLLPDSSKLSNVVFSPLSIHVVLSMIAAGSTAGSGTRSELLSFLKSPSLGRLNSFASKVGSVVFSDGSPAGGPKLSFVNGLWLNVPLKPSFKQVVDTSYGAATHLVNFRTKAAEVTHQVNSWAEKKTSGLIQDLLPPEDAEFHLLNGSRVQVPFMTSKKRQAVRAFDGFKVLELPYKQGSGDQRRFSMYLYLPDAEDGLPALVEKLCSEPGFLDRHLPQWKVAVGDFRIPSFKISHKFEGRSVLPKLGVIQLFGAGGLTGMVNPPMDQGLRVSEIFHESFIEVNEEGSKAAAATAAVIGVRGSLPVSRVDFVADHPFMFLIRENMTRTVLFVGQVLDPSTSPSIRRAH